MDLVQSRARGECLALGKRGEIHRHNVMPRVAAHRRPCERSPRRAGRCREGEVRNLETRLLSYAVRIQNPNHMPAPELSVTGQ